MWALALWAQVPHRVRCQKDSAWLAPTRSIAKLFELGQQGVGLCDCDALRDVCNAMSATVTIELATQRPPRTLPTAASSCGRLAGCCAGRSPAPARLADRHAGRRSPAHRCLALHTAFHE